VPFHEAGFGGSLGVGTAKKEALNEKKTGRANLGLNYF